MTLPRSLSALSRSARCLSTSLPRSILIKPQPKPAAVSAPSAAPSVPDQSELSPLPDPYKQSPAFSEEDSPVQGHDWRTSTHGLSVEPFPREAANVLMADLAPDDIECKPDGLIYLPEIKYRRILNKAFGPGGWGLAPRGDLNVGTRMVSREYALICLGRLVSIARGEQEYFDPTGIPTATEGCKSNALMRCCKDLGIGSELWDPRFIQKFKEKHCIEVWAEHVTTKKKKKVWRRRDCKLSYPFSET